MDKETKEMLEAILHAVQLNGAKVDGLQASVDRIEGTLSRHEKRLDSYRSRIAAVEEQLNLFGETDN
jgi:predicted  nucleic acid-binding Zn-ribbon protein